MKYNKLKALFKAPLALLMALFMLFSLAGCELSVLTEDRLPPESTVFPNTVVTAIERDGYYYSKDDVSLYLDTYGELPPNYITKDEAAELGWEGGSVERYLEGAAIGGDIFGNREGLLPKKDGRVYYECDINTNGAASRGAERIVYSNDGLIYYTPDHYESFILLDGEAE